VDLSSGKHFNLSAAKGGFGRHYYKRSIYKKTLRKCSGVFLKDKSATQQAMIVVIQHGSKNNATKFGHEELCYQLKNYYLAFVASHPSTGGFLLSIFDESFHIRIVLYSMFQIPPSSG
jgi:hypothetical protein